jgi:hypothetical protein
MREKLTETSLSAPVAAYFGGLGYTVRAEVKHCDLVAVRDAEIVAVELKLTLNLDVLVQATRRQQVADKVYIAVPRPRYVGRTARWRGILHLLRRLELGLLLVGFTSTPPSVEAVLSPEPSPSKRKSKARQALKEEAANRSLDLNVGGSARRKLMTSYRENALRIAYLLAQHGPLSAKRLRELGTNLKTWSTLHRNVYGYYTRLDRGLYDLTEDGRRELKQYAELVTPWASK